MSIRIIPLGAGQEVGRSCVLVKIKDITVMFDCGVHMAQSDNRKFPDFSRVIEGMDEPYETDPDIFFNLKKAKGKNFDSAVDLVVITHFHLDHCASLPYFTEFVGYNGPIVTSQPTKAIMPIMLEDFKRIISDFKGEISPISSEDIKRCINKVRTIELGEEIQISSRIKLRAFYGGHVLGACMYQVEVDGLTALYTGDFNTSPDHHLKGAFMPKLKPDVFITETTKADTIRDTKRVREREFIDKITSTVAKGGKVLIPVFALGRAQELCVMLDTHWKRNKLDVPIYFSGNLAEKATFYYKLFVSWTNQKVNSIFEDRNVFDFKFVQKGNKTLGKSKGPMVIFATPGMLHGGLSLSLFCDLAEDSKNAVIIPGYCISGTPGHKILSGDKDLIIDGKKVKVCCDVSYMSFSAHADAKGILGLIKQSKPKNIVLVHGDVEVMRSFYKTVTDSLGIYTKFPGNHSEVAFHEDKLYYRVSMSRELFSLISFYYQICKRNLQKDKRIRVNRVGAELLAIKPKRKLKSVLNRVFISNPKNKTLDEFLALVQMKFGSIMVVKEGLSTVEMSFEAEKIVVKWRVDSSFGEYEEGAVSRLLRNLEIFTKI